MDCKTATWVCKTGNPLSEIREIFPEAWEFLSAQSLAFVSGKDDEFDAAIKRCWAILLLGCFWNSIFLKLWVALFILVRLAVRVV